MISDKPKISIITVVRDAAGDLMKTADSVLSQTYPHIEYIIIDGGSTDGTVELIKRYSGRIAGWISEPDDGIYDAMNKGLQKATGEWVSFMNAGDVFNNDQVLSQVFQDDQSGADVIFGDSIARYPKFMALRKALPVEDLWKGMICSHQSMFFRTSLIRNDAYKPALSLAADYELILRLHSGGKSFRYKPLVIAVFDTRGISNIKMVKSARSIRAILEYNLSITPRQKKYHRKFIFQSGITEWVYKLFPSMFIHVLLKWLYRDQIVNDPKTPGTDT